MKDRERPVLTPFELECLRRAQADTRARGGELRIVVAFNTVKKKPMSEAPLFGEVNIIQKQLF